MKRLARNVIYNSKVSLHKWVDKVLTESLLGLDQQGELYIVAKRVIDDGGLRGDVSEAWVKLGYGHTELNHLLL